MRSPTSSGRIVKWAMELTHYGLEYKPRLAIKAQALADFIVECKATSCRTTLEDLPDEDGWLEMHTDGATSSQHYGGGVMLTSLKFFKTYCSLFKTSNNGAEYKAVIPRLRLADSLKVEKLRIKTESRLVVGQLKGDFVAKEEGMMLYKDVTECLLTRLSKRG